MKRQRSVAPVLSVVLVALSTASSALALNPALDVSQYAHTAWTIRDGFLNSRVLSIAQTPDGYLWVGTETGLFRFDGVQLTPWGTRGQTPLPHSTIAKLLVTRDGRLWIGTLGGLASWKDGRLITYPELSGQGVDALVEDSQGTVWAGTLAVPSAHLCAIRSAVECAGQDGRFGNAVLSLLEDRGTLWVGAATGLWRWAPGEPTRFATPDRNSSDLLRIDAGPLLIAMPGGVMQLAGERVVPYRIGAIDRPFNPRSLLMDRNGALWTGTVREGLVHVHEGRTDVFLPANGLSGDAISVVYEDREGSIWVGTNEGLDRFRELAVTTVSSRQGLPSDSSLSVLPARDGSIWVGSSVGAARLRNGRTTSYRKRDGLPDDRVGTMFEDSAGRILLSTIVGLAAFDTDRFVALRSVPTRVVYNIVEERPGDFWIIDQEAGLMHLIGNEVVKRIPWSALGHEDHANALALDRTRRGLWLGFYNGGIAFVQDGAVRASYGTAEGLGAGRVSELRLDEDGTLWAATAGGLSRMKDGRIATLTTANGLPCDAVHWVMREADGSQWFLMPCGLVRIASTEMAAWLADPNRSVTSTLFDSSDGVRTQAVPIGFNPTAAWLADGRLAFASSNGVAVVDPRHLSFNAIPPPVHVERIVADRETFETTEHDGSLTLPAGVHDLQIDYTALSLVAPEKMRFRYKLEGADRDWRYVGNRRQAFYTDLAPRRYRFRVAAANNSGVWSETDAMVDFSIAPAFYQTAWFLTFSAGVVVTVVWAADRLRLHMVEKHEREISALNERLMKAQEQERIRIAGELHDGVMQQMLAVTMMLGTAKRRIGGDSDARATIDKVQEKLIRVGTDIRQLSHDLHPPILQEAGLPEPIRNYSEQFSASSGVAVACDADESVRDLSRGAAPALFRIVQEALGNAAKHAHPTRVTVCLTRSANDVSLAVSDNGAGFEPGQLATSGGLG